METLYGRIGTGLLQKSQTFKRTTLISRCLQRIRWIYLLLMRAIINTLKLCAIWGLCKRLTAQ